MYLSIVETYHCHPREGMMRSLVDVVGNAEEIQNLKSGGLVVAALCVLIVVLFVLMSVGIAIEPGI